MGTLVLNKIRQFIWKFFLKNRYYNKDGSPKRCKYCGSTSFFTYVRDRWECLGLITEEEYCCKDCNSSIAYWVTGYFDPAYREYYK